MGTANCKSNCTSNNATNEVEDGQRTAADMLAHEKCFYMNFKILNLKEAFPKIMAGKMRDQGKGELFAKLVGKGAGFIAANPRFGKIFSNKISDNLVHHIPETTKKKGIDFVLSKVHETDNGLIVIRAEVVDVDLEKMIDDMKGEKMSEDLVEHIKPWLSTARRFVDLPAKVAPMIQDKMCKAFEESIPKKLGEKTGMQLMLINRFTDQQAEFFFDAMSVHRFDVIVSISNLKEAIPQLINKRIKYRWGSNPITHVAGAVAGKYSSRNAERMFARRAGTTMRAGLGEWLEDHGVGVEVMKTFATKTGGTIVLRCQIAAPLVDLPEFRKTGYMQKVSDHEEFLRLGHDGKQQVYQAIRNYIQTEYPQMLIAKSEGILKVSAHVTDQLESNIHPEMQDEDAHSDVEEASEGQLPQ